jgi:aspartyl-tRNA(Asn)/glutamyl-tRNA(Gln) amidotransferase subunit A
MIQSPAHATFAGCDRPGEPPSFFTAAMAGAKPGRASRGIAETSDISERGGPPMSDGLVWASALDLAAMVRQKQVSPVEITEAILARIERFQSRLNAFCLIAYDRARAAAREAEIAVMKGEPLGSLHGVPFAVKDVLFTQGVTTTGGSRLFEEVLPEEDAIAVGRLKAAGGVLLGKTNTSEFGHKAVTECPLFGVTRNPWDPTLTPGGSSGGAAAAVAAGLGPIGLGTDGGGSIRIPAAFCNVYGIKPSYGRVPNYPGFPGWQHFSHVGPITRTVRDAAVALDVMAGPDDRDRASLPEAAGSYLQACEQEVSGLHVAWSPDLGFARVDPAVLDLCQTAAAEFESLGCHVEVVNCGWESPEEIFSTILSAQFYAAWADRLPAAEALMDRTLVKFLQRGSTVTAQQYLHAWARVDAFWLEVQRFLDRFDLLLTPSVAVLPFEAGMPSPREVAGERVSVLGWMPFTYAFNLTGQPAASLPAGFTERGLPVGLQLVGRRHADGTVLAASAAYEAACPWAARHPPEA